MGMVAAAVVPILVAVILSSPYQFQRVITFLNPQADPQGKGYHIIQSLIAIAHSGFWGLGLGQSVQKMYFLPEPHTDFIFAVVAEELGFIGCAVIIFAFLYLFFRGIMASRHPDPFFRWLGTGIICQILFQTIINTSMVANMGPTKGIPLPFISMGGSSLLLSLTMLGIVLNLSREVTGDR